MSMAISDLQRRQLAAEVAQAEKQSISTASLATGVASVNLSAGATVLYGFSIRESAGVAAAATVIVRDGTTDAGAIIAVIELAANGSVGPFWFGPQGINCPNGLRVQRVAGETEGGFYFE